MEGDIESDENRNGSDHYSQINKGIDVRSYNLARGKQKKKSWVEHHFENNKFGTKAQVKGLLDEKDTKRSLWWLDKDQIGSSADKIQKWIKAQDIRHGFEEEEEEPKVQAVDDPSPMLEEEKLEKADSSRAKPKLLNSKTEDLQANKLVSINLLSQAE